MEIGPGNLWPGQEFVKRFPETDLVGVGYTEEQCRAAWAAAVQSGIARRVAYFPGTPEKFSLEDRSQDAVVALGALRFWKHPGSVLDEIQRVLKIGGMFWVGDARRDLGWIQAWAARSHPAQGSLYARREGCLTQAELQEALFYSNLEEGKAEVLGPDVWIHSG